MRKILFLLLACLPFLATTAQTDGNDAKYLSGAVPVKDGYVIFEEHVNVPGKSKSEIFELLKQYTQQAVVEGENHLPNSRITEASESEGIIAASIEEWLYFRRSALVTHRTKFMYQLVFSVADGGYDVSLRRLRYLYEETEQPGIETNYPAEKWITDEEALTKNGKKLTRIGGKFRRFTIDRKDEIFSNAARACGVESPSCCKTDNGK